MLAAIFVAYELGSRSLWLDESATVAITAQHGSALWHAIAHDGGNMLAYYLLLHVLTGLFGHGAALVRIPSAIATVATVATVGLLGRMLFDRAVALSAGVLAAVSLPLVFWGQNARGYAPMVWLVAASFLCLVRILQTPEGERVPRGPLIGYGLTLLLAIYTGFVAVLIVPAQLALLASRRAHARAVVATVALVGVACVPLLVLAVNRGSGQLFWVPSLSAAELSQAGRWLTSAGMAPNFHRTATGAPTFWLTLALLLAAIALAARPGRARGALVGRDWRPLVPLAWLFVPVVIGVVLLLAGEPVELGRGALMLLPGVALVLAWAVFALVSVRSLAWLAVGGLVALRALQLAPSYGKSPENWRAATSYVARNARSMDCVAFYPQDSRMAFDYYLSQPAGAPARSRLVPVFPDAPWSAITPYVERYDSPAPATIEAIVRRCPRVWLLASHQGRRNGPAGSRENLARYERLKAALGRGYARERATSFSHAAVIHVTLLSDRR